MKNGFYLLSIIVFSLVAFSCNKEQNIEVTIICGDNSHRISAQQAINLAVEFVQRCDAGTRTTGAIKKNVQKIFAVSGKRFATRAIDPSINLDTLLYVVQFEDNQGFVISSADNRFNGILAYIEEGYFEEDSLFSTPGYADFIEDVIEEMLEKYVREPDIPGKFEPYTDSIQGEWAHDENGNPYPYFEPIFEYMQPLLKTKWGQEGPYNYFCEGNKAGCVPIAMAQICSFLKMPFQVSWGHNGQSASAIMDWNYIQQNPNSQIDSLIFIPVAHLVRMLGLAFDADYGTGSTSVNSDYAIEVVKNTLLWDATDLLDYDSIMVMNSLKQGSNIIYMCGKRRNDQLFPLYKGHGWVVDGYILNWPSLHNKQLFLHCNWGWYGECNGFFSAHYFDAYNGIKYRDNGSPTASTSTQSRNYSFQKKVSIITR